MLHALVGSTLASSSVNGVVYAPPIVRQETVYVLGGERVTALDLAG